MTSQIKAWKCLSPSFHIYIFVHHSWMFLIITPIPSKSKLQFDFEHPPSSTGSYPDTVAAEQPLTYHSALHLHLLFFNFCTLKNSTSSSSYFLLWTWDESLTLELSHDLHFYSCWEMTLTEASEAFISLTVILGSLLVSWMSHSWAVGVISLSYHSCKGSPVFLRRYYSLR